MAWMVRPGGLDSDQARWERVEPGNPLGIAGLSDLPGLTLALCADQVPGGRAALRALDAAGVVLVPATLEQDVKAALAKVELGEVDAALVDYILSELGMSVLADAGFQEP